MEDLEHSRSDTTPRRRSSGRRTNLALAVLLPLVVFTGALSFAVGVDLQIDPAAVHAVLALGVALLTPWKSAIVRRGLRRRRPSRYISAALGTLVAVALISGLVQAAGWTDRVGPLTLMQIHVGAGIGALLMVWLHYRSHPVRFRRLDFDRRSFLRSAGLAGLAAVVWGAWESTVRAAGWPGAERRFTGSHERGSHDPRRLPVTSWFNDRTPRIPGSEWRLRADGEELGLSDLDLLPRERVTAILDCTGGWYSEQVWEGVRLDRLVEPGEARSVVNTVGDRIPASLSLHRPFPPVARHPSGRSAAEPRSRVPRPPGGSGTPGLLVGQMGGGDGDIAAALVAPASLPAHLTDPAETRWPHLAGQSLGKVIGKTSPLGLKNVPGMLHPVGTTQTSCGPDRSIITTVSITRRTPQQSPPARST